MLSREWLQKTKLSEIKEIPPECNRLFIDVGTAIDAPNSAAWLLDYKEAFVIGIEPSPINAEILKKGRPHVDNLPYLCLDAGYAVLNDQKKEIGGRFQLLECAIGNVEDPTLLPFYLTNKINTGCSSLLKPTSKLDLIFGTSCLDKVCNVPVISLKDVLDNIPFEEFGYVTYLKTDCQGTDLEAVKSCKKYLKRVLLIQMEVRTDGQYEKEQSIEDIDSFMQSSGFVQKAGHTYDRVYINEDLARSVEVPEVRFIST